MNNGEKIFEHKKKEIESMEVPLELEGRLRDALVHKTPIKNRRFTPGRLIAACLILVLISFNLNTLASYGRQIIGFNDVMDGTLRELNTLGKGQLIDKRYTFKNGVSVTLDGIMIDESQLLAFYTIESPGGDAEHVLSTPSLNGSKRTYRPQFGYGDLSEDRIIMKNLQSFEPPKFFEKQLTMSFQLMEGNPAERGEISFEIDRKKAMGHTLKVKLNKSIKAGKTTMQFKTLLAAPTRTVIKGEIQRALELAIDHIKGERLRPVEVNLKLIANGEEMQPRGGGMTTGINGITFEHHFEALPEQLRSLKLEVVSFLADYDINEIIPLDRNQEEQIVQVKNQNITINNCYVSDGNTFLNITTEEGIRLTRVYLVVDGKRIELNQTIEDQYDKQLDGKVIHTRTLEFEGMGTENGAYQLEIKKMTYPERINQVIEIPIL